MTDHQHPHVGLAMIVRDEIDTIERCLASARPHVDTWTIVDAGSADGTQDRVRELMDGIPGNLVALAGHDGLIGMNKASEIRFEKAKGTADWLLCLHGDMTIEEWQKPRGLVADAYMIPEIDEISGARLHNMRMFRGNRNWRYEGRAHEHIESDHPFAVADLPGTLIRHHRDSKTKATNADILAALQLDLIEKPNDPRTIFYIAQTLAEMGRPIEAAAMYQRRVWQGGWDEETHIALYRLGCLLCENGNSEEGMHRLIDAWLMRKTRAEGLRALANVANSIADRLEFPAADKLCVEPTAYGPRDVALPVSSTSD